MYEPLEQNRMAKTQWKTPHYGAGAGILVLGLIAGRAFFPLEIPKPFVVEKEKRVEVPVERVVIQKEPFEVIKYVDRIVEKRVEVPVEKRVEVPVVKVVEKMVEVPVDRIVYRDRFIEKKEQYIDKNLSAWRKITTGLTRDQVREILGEPKKIETSIFERWYYADYAYCDMPASVKFSQGFVSGWQEP
jgi:hypothetical protein